MKIGIVNELPLAANTLRRALALEKGHHVVWSATSGTEAVEQCALNTPDLVLMDLAMAGMDGVEVTRRIMASSPCAILIITDSVRANAARVFDAMGRGALDVVDMPALDPANLPRSAAPLLTKIATISRLVSEKDGDHGGAEVRKAPASGLRDDRLIAMGASAGGPGALATVLAGLPKDFGAAIVIVQHVDSQFAAGMTEWLSRHSALPVRVAKEGDRPAAGIVLMAGTGDHLTLKTADRLGYTPEPGHYAYRPSVDVFFHSVSRLWRGDVVGVLLTGMGSDGALGLKALRNHGHHTIAQDEASSAVYGMPKAAAALKAAVEILPMERIAARLVDVLGSRVELNRNSTLKG